MNKKTTDRGAAKKTRKRPAMPGKADILAFIEESPGKVGKREIARAFHVNGSQRIALKALMREMADEGLIERRRKAVRKPGTLPPVAVITISGRDVDGELLASPERWDEDSPPPAITLAPAAHPGGRRKGSAIGVGDRILARLSREADGGYEARLIRRLDTSTRQLIGVYRTSPQGDIIVPTDKKERRPYAVEPGAPPDIRPGDLVLGQIVHGQRRFGGRSGTARIVERLGNENEARAFSLIAIHSHGIPEAFSPAALAGAEAAEPAPTAGRKDYRALPFVTIDPADARDHDDAIWAAADDTPGNAGGWQIMVAIADVAFYVRPGSALDTAARDRGNSAYFPDRVVPMLPERLSTDLCSLIAGHDRPVLVARLRIDGGGTSLEYDFVRATIRSQADLHYRQVQDLVDGTAEDPVAGPLKDSVIGPLYGAWKALDAAREARQPLAIDLPERRIVLDDQGQVSTIALRQRLDSHRLVEEFMIAANVAAAKTLGQRRRPCLYRVHEPPPPDKLESLRDFMDGIGLRLGRGGITAPADFNHLLRQAAGSGTESLLNEIILRTQTQAYYSPQHHGHFGLHLRSYAHFTSPIRRYADVLVHRSLIATLGLGAGGMSDQDAEALAATAEHISITERRAMLAERDARDRYLAAFLAERCGAVFEGRISGVTRFGLFVTLDESGADGLVPMRSLGSEYWHHDEKQHALIGERSGHCYRLGTPVTVRLVEAAPLTGGIRLEVLADTRPESPPSGSGKKNKKPKKSKKRLR